MSKNKRRPSTPAPSAQVAAPRSPEHPGKIRWLMGGGFVVVAATVAGLYWFAHRGPAKPFPAPGRQAPAAHVAFEDFMGSEACAECHADQYASWKGSTHGQAGGPPTPERVIAPFNGRPMYFKDAVVTPSMSSAREYLFTVTRKNHPVQVFAVADVVGGGFMAGGGTQAFFGKFPDGTLRFLPFDYSKTTGRWFCNTLGRANLASVPVTPAIALADCGDWPPNRILGSAEQFQGCQQCHGSQIDVSFDTTTARYQTRFTTLAINCESCHGPGRRHVELARSGKMDGVDIGMTALATLPKEQSIQVCFRCHAVKATIQPNYLPGKPLEAHFALKLPLLLDTLYFPDGRTRAFAYQEGHLSSDCYLEGSMTCVDCHDPHTQRYRDISGTALPGRLDNGQCLDCHPSKAQPVARHTHHAATSPGSRCVSCHMPYFQEPSVGHQIRYARSDHAIAIPRPGYDAGLGLESACQQCHRNQTTSQLQAQVDRWYGPIKPLPAPVQAAFAAENVAELSSAARRILESPDRDAMAEVAGLIRLVQRYATPDQPGFEGETTARLEQFARSPDIDVQALALGLLHLSRGTDPAVRRFLTRQLRDLGPNESLVRDRWAWILKARGDAYLKAGDYSSAVQTYQKGTEVKPNDPSAFRNLGFAYTRLRDYDRAVEQLRHSLEIDRRQPQVLIDLGFALMQRGDLGGADSAYRQAIAISPYEPAAYANLGVIYLRRREVPPAIDALEKALSLDPSLADASFLLANAYAAQNRFADAVRAVKQGMEFDPRNPQAQRLLEQLERQVTR